MYKGTVEFIAGAMPKVKYSYRGKNKFSCNTSNIPLTVDSIEYVELQDTQHTTSAGGAVKGAAIGSLLVGGGVGLLAGALVGKDKDWAMVKFYFKNRTKALAKCDMNMLQVLQELIFEGKIKEGNPELLQPALLQQLSSVQPQPQIQPQPYSLEYKEEKRPKRGIWKKILIGFAFLALLGALGKEAEKNKTVKNQSQEVTQEKEKSKSKNPCEGITQEKWDKASKLWKMNHEECRPKSVKKTKR